MKNLVRALRAMADEPRMTILSVLSIRGAVCVSHLQEAMKTPQPTVSRYLSILRNAGLLESERRGQWVYYGLSHDDGSLVMEMIRRASEQLKDTAKIKRIMERLDKLEQQPTLTEESIAVQPKVKPKGEKRAARKHEKAAREDETPAVEVAEEKRQEVAVAPVALEPAESMPEEEVSQQKEPSEEPSFQHEVMEPDKADETDKAPESEGKKRTRRKKQQLPSLFDF